MRIRLGGQLVSLPASLDRTKLNPWFMNRAVVAMMVAGGGGGGGGETTQSALWRDRGRQGGE